MVPKAKHFTVTQPEALSLQHTAVLLDVCVNTLRNWIKTGKLKASRCGPRLLRVPRSEIVRLRGRHD